MKIVRVAHPEGIGFGLIDDEGDVVMLAGPPAGEIRPTDTRLPLSECRILAPTLPSKVVCVGRNYADHAAELGNEMPERPLLFLKPSTSVIGPGEAIRKPAASERLDHEGELAVVVSGLVRNADETAAAEAILGYTIANDVTARDLQKMDGQWTRGKGYDTFCPLGPVIETAVRWDELEITVKVNGQVRQKGPTSDMFYDPISLVSYVSRIMTLLPGDVILTGTPAGVGPMEPGDECEVSIPGIGSLRNPVVAQH